MLKLGGGLVFHKPKLMKIYTKKSVAYILRFVFCLVFLYFASEAYDVFTNGSTITKRGEYVSRNESPFSYWLEIVYLSSLAAICLHLFFSVRVKPSSEE